MEALVLAIVLGLMAGPLQDDGSARTEVKGARAGEISEESQDATHAGEDQLLIGLLTEQFHVRCVERKSEWYDPYFEIGFVNIDTSTDALKTELNCLQGQARCGYSQVCPDCEERGEFRRAQEGSKLSEELRDDAVAR